MSNTFCSLLLRFWFRLCNLQQNERHFAASDSKYSDFLLFALSLFLFVHFLLFVFLHLNFMYMSVYIATLLFTHMTLLPGR